MPVLRCDVITCVHNCDDRCCRQGIEVEGQHACKEDETCCASFAKRTGDCCSNVSSDAKNQLSVKCQAVECIFNSERICSANHIGISGRNAGNAQETLCSSFDKQ